MEKSETPKCLYCLVNDCAKKTPDSDCWGIHDCSFCKHLYYWNLCDECFATENED